MSSTCQSCSTSGILPAPPPFPGCPPSPPARVCNARWGDIEGEVSDQEDLVQYLLANFYTESETYSKGQIDANFPTFTDVYLKSSVYTKGEGDARYARLDQSNTFTQRQLIQGMTVGQPAIENTVYGEEAAAGIIAGTASSSSSTALGYRAMRGATSGSGYATVGTTAVGAGALQSFPGAGSSTPGVADNNTAVGYNALPALVSGARNTAIGQGAGLVASVCSGNTLIGTQAGRNVSTGTSNVVVGSEAGWGIGTQTQNTLVGTDTNVSAGVSQGVALGYGAVVAHNRSAALGYVSSTTKADQVMVGGTFTVETALRGAFALVSRNLPSSTGAVSSNTACGSVNFAAGATSLVVTNNLALARASATVGSVILTTLRTNDATAVLGAAVVTADGSFTIHMKTAPTATTRVDYLIIN